MNGGLQTLSIIVPAYNEEEVLPVFNKRLIDVLANIPLNAEIVYINDGSSDNTLKIIHEFRAADNRVTIIDLSRNFGKEVATSAGLDFAQGDAVVIIDADLQDPPELIPELIKKWNNGFDIVYAQRISRSGETILKKTTASLFYKLMQQVGEVVIPPNTGDFRLLSRRAVDSLTKMREKHRFMKGLFTWIGYPQTSVQYNRDPRYAGETKWNYLRLWNLAVEGFTSFTITPLKVSTFLGLLSSVTAFIYAMFIIYKTLAFGEPVRGYPSLMVIILSLGGIQLLALGVIGEYIGRIFNETKRRPLYFLNNYHPSSLSENDNRNNAKQPSSIRRGVQGGEI